MFVVLTLIAACPAISHARPTGVTNAIDSFTRDTYCADVVSESYSAVSPSGRFKIWYVTDPLNDDAIPDTTDLRDSALAGSPDGVPDSINVWARYFDDAYDTLVTTLGYSPPVPDTQPGLVFMTTDTSAAGGDGKLDVYFTSHVLSATGGSSYGQIVWEAYNSNPGGPDSFTGYIMINSDSIGENSAKANASLVRHELFHLVQANYDGNDSAWLNEGTAEWMEIYGSGSAAGTDVNLEYLFAQEFPLLNEDPERRYVTSLFFLFLAERYPAGDIIREIWERSRSNWGVKPNGAGDVESIENLAAELQERGTTVNAVFRDFIIANAVISGQYEEASLWLQMMQDYAGYKPPFVIDSHVIAAGSFLAETTPAGNRPGYLGYNLISFVPRAGDSGSLELSFDGNNRIGGGDDNGDSWMVFALAMKDSAHFDTYLFSISAVDRTGNVTIDSFGGLYDTVVLAVCPVTPRPWTDSNIPYSYSASFDASGLDTADPNLWYVNDTSPAGDSFTSTTGSDANDGLTPSTPKRTISALMSLLTQGDTILIDAGIFQETVAIGTNYVALIGKDSASTIIDARDSVPVTTRVINVQNCTGIILRDLQVRNGNIGISWSNVDSAEITRVHANRNWTAGIYLLDGSDFCRITGSFSSSASAGIYLYISSYNTLTGNTSSGNTNDGISLTSSSDGNVLVNNTSTGNANLGFLLSSSNGNTLTGNVSSANTLNGFHLNSSSNNVLTRNTSSNNSGAAFYFSTANNNIARQNTADSNGSWAVYIDGTSSSDTFLKNNFIGSPTRPDSGVSINGASNAAFTRNFWNTTDSVVLRGRIRGAGAASVSYSPYRLGVVDTAPGADTVAPDPPVVTSIDTLYAQIRLFWNPPAGNEDGAGGATSITKYRLYRSLVPAPTDWGAPRAEIGAGSTSFSDTTPAPDTTYYYRLTAVDDAPIRNESFYSNILSQSTIRKIGDFSGGGTVNRDAVPLILRVFMDPARYELLYDIGRNGPDSVIDHEDFLELGTRFGQ